MQVLSTSYPVPSCCPVTKLCLLFLVRVLLPDNGKLQPRRRAGPPFRSHDFLRGCLILVAPGVGATVWKPIRPQIFRCGSSPTSARNSIAQTLGHRRRPLRFDFDRSLASGCVVAEAAPAPVLRGGTPSCAPIWRASGIMSSKGNPKVVGKPQLLRIAQDFGARLRRRANASTSPRSLSAHLRSRPFARARDDKRVPSAEALGYDASSVRGLTLLPASHRSRRPKGLLFHQTTSGAEAHIFMSSLRHGRCASRARFATLA